jgi:hypothetical protein
MDDRYARHIQRQKQITKERTINSQGGDSSIRSGWSFFLQIEKWGRMELKCEGWNRKINMNDRYARHIHKTDTEREPRNVPFIVKDGLPGGTFVVTALVVIAAEGFFFL